MAFVKTKMFCRNTTFLQNSGIALMVPFQITSQPAGLPWSSLTNTWVHTFPSSDKSGSFAHTSPVSPSHSSQIMNPAGISMLIHKWWLTKSNQHPGQISIAQKPAKTAVLVPKPEKIGISR